MKHHDEPTSITRRELVTRLTTTAIVSVIATPLGGALNQAFALSAKAEPVTAVAGVDRVVMKQGKTYLRGWTGYGASPRAGRGGRGAAAPAVSSGPVPATTWSKVSGPGTVTFADARAAATTATFSAPGDYVLQVTADNGETKASSTVTVRVELPPPPVRLAPVVTKRHTITSPLWKARTKSLIVSWIPHCIETCNRTDIQAGRGDGGIDNFIEAAKAHRGESYAPHKGYVFSNAWVHQTVESMSLALMVDPQGDQQIIDAQQAMRARPWMIGFQKFSPHNIPTAICKPRLRCAMHRAPRAPEFPGDRTNRGLNAGKRRRAPITKGMLAAISSSRPSITTR